jgi:hypothetical protein
MIFFSKIVTTKVFSVVPEMRNEKNLFTLRKALGNIGLSFLSFGFNLP